MIQRGKWLKGTTASQPVSDAARQALGTRLEVVVHYLPLAATQPKQDVEFVHQLRVATRRATSAMRIFHQLLPERRARWLLKQLKKARRAAGDARDLDVLMMRFATTVDGMSADECEQICGVLREHRERAQQPLIRCHTRLWEKDRFQRRVKALVKRIKWRGKGREPDFGTAARSMIRPSLDEFLEAGQADLSDTEALHQLRICGKQLRYAMELLSGAFDEPFRQEIYPMVVEVQGKLGEVNDHATARLRYQRWLGNRPELFQNGTLAHLVEMEGALIAAGVEDFRAWWSVDRVDDLRERMNAMIER